MFSADAKDEIARAALDRPCCRTAFVRALARFSRSARTGVLVSTERPATARAALAAAKSIGMPTAMVRRSQRRLRRRVVYDVVARDPLAAGVEPPGRACCRRAWLRGAFLACGSVTDPARAYHLEFFGRSRRDGVALRGVLRSFGVRASLALRRKRPLVYVKGAEAVADALARLGANQSVFALDNVRVLRQTKNDIRRRVNSEAANAARSAVSSARQREAARRAIAHAARRRLSAALLQAAKLRIAHPEMTLAELAARARPQITKAAMGYRMRALERLTPRNGKRLGQVRPT